MAPSIDDFNKAINYSVLADDRVTFYKSKMGGLLTALPSWDISIARGISTHVNKTIFLYPTNSDYNKENIANTIWKYFFEWIATYSININKYYGPKPTTFVGPPKPTTISKFVGPPKPIPTFHEYLIKAIVDPLFPKPSKQTSKKLLFGGILVVLFFLNKNKKFKF